ncbi:phenoloxidase 1-like [Planococcus citri]|uniref:phenoloxidase 1-like n=1 Tax=Planococcus citri TaxID=170843 RepID=UPI0031F809D1
MSSSQAVPIDAVNHLFERPTEPLFNRKGGDGSVQFVIPDSYYPDKYKGVPIQVDTRGPATTYNIKALSTLPNLSQISALPYNTSFSVFNDFHRSCATKLIDLLLDAKAEDFISLASYCRDRVNPYLYQYALSIALLHRTDTKNFPIPSHLSSFPELFMDRSIFAQAREEENIVPQGSRRPIEIPRDYTSSDLELEHLLAYFREDVGVNLHHWHWHLVYPLDGRREIVNKDRRGELFYYMHSQILSRYNMERLCNHLARVKRFLDFREPIEEGYFPKLDNFVASRLWPSRNQNTRLSNVNREHDRLRVDIQELERWRDRLYEAIHNGRYLVQGKNETQQFTVETGIDILGNMIESNILSVNRTEYGNLHNQGHNLISYSHDPDGQYLELFGVMGESSTAMRDPIFYRWHAFVNGMFEEYKHTLPPYTPQELNFENIKITGVQIKATGLPDNEIGTFWQQADIDLSRGLDFAEQRGSVFARVTHLQHTPFTYTINVNNGGSARVGTVRIFYAPKFDERNLGFIFRDQKSLFVELDRFTTNLKSGANTITRRSVESSVTIPYEQTFRNLSTRPAAGSAEEAAYNFCGCGWPHHMLIAKGHSGGFPCELFVMISNYDNDSVQRPNTSTSCDDASSYCGIRDSKYPDRRHMGFPLDRLPREGVVTLKDFLTPNMAVQDIAIRFNERIVPPIQKSGNKN